MLASWAESGRTKKRAVSRVKIFLIRLETSAMEEEILARNSSFSKS
jgi:hypothetical protein